MNLQTTQRVEPQKNENGLLNGLQKQEIKQLQSGLYQCPMTSCNRTVEQMLIENEHILIEIQAESKSRKNKNAISPRMSLLTNKLERNIIRISRLVPPQALGDPNHVAQEKERFIRYYQKRNSVKKSTNGIATQPAKKQN